MSKWNGKDEVIQEDKKKEKIREILQDVNRHKTKAKMIKFN
jgi:hypothetical protein